MINNPIPLVRISTVTTADTVTDFESTYTQPITSKGRGIIVTSKSSIKL